MNRNQQPRCWRLKARNRQKKRQLPNNKQKHNVFIDGIHSIHIKSPFRSFDSIRYSIIVILILSMTEHFTEADSLITFYTKDFGKVVAKAKGAKRIVSKLSAHLEPLNFVLVRLIEGRGFQIADALTINNQSLLRRTPTDLKKIKCFLRPMRFENPGK